MSRKRGADGPKGQPMLRQSLVEELGERLAQEIMDGQLPPGTRLEEVILAGRFGVSRTPVREALRHLAATGLVQKRPHRGVLVTSIERAQLVQMFEAMAELEAVAARLAAVRMTAAERDTLLELHVGSIELVRAADHHGYEAFNRQFHELLYAGSHNLEIVGLVRTMRRRVAPFRRAQFLLPGRLASSHSEHAQVVEYVVAGDAERASEAMRAHLQLVGGASAALLDSLDEVNAAGLQGAVRRSTGPAGRPPAPFSQAAASTALEQSLAGSQRDDQEDHEGDDADEE